MSAASWHVAIMFAGFFVAFLVIIATGLWLLSTYPGGRR